MKRQGRKTGKNKRLSQVVSFFFHLRRHPSALRRLAFLWLWLIAAEIACPILDFAKAADFNSSATVATAEIFEPHPAGSVWPETSADEPTLAVKESAAPEHCSDECLCHLTAILGLDFNFPGIFTNYSPILRPYKNPPAISLAPPYEPPKNA